MINTNKQALVAAKQPYVKLAVVLSIIALSLVGAGAAVRAVSCSSAGECNSKIQELRQKNAKNESSLDNLQSMAQDYQDTIDKLQSQIDSFQKAINANKKEQADLKAKIAKYQKQIDKQKSTLSSDIKAMYVDGDMSSIEMLASSSNLSDYVDKQEYRSAVQEKIQSTLNKITALQVQLKSKKNKVDELVAKQKNQQAQVAADKRQKDKLLSYNESQQDDYTAKIQATNNQVAALQKQRAAALSNLTGSNGRSKMGAAIKYKNFWKNGTTCGGGYSYCAAGFNQRVYGPWGSGLAHQCVNFVSDWLDRHGFDGPSYPGNADQWPSYGAHVSPSNVRVGDVAYMPIAPVGHVGVVSAVNNDGTFHIKQMNWPVGGYYSEMDLYPQNITFVRFPHK